MGSPEERPIPEWMNPYIDLYLNEARPVLLRASTVPTDALWISSNTGKPMSGDDIGPLITQLTEQTIGIGISPHLFRTADATTAAEARGDMPHLASALLGHKHARVTEEHYNRASSLRAASMYAKVVLQKHFS
jgi:integrase